MERFWSKVEKSDGCWEWQGFKNAHGYGRFYFRGAASRAHRVAWILTHGAIPAGQHVLHSCDNPGCVRPEHLHLGTHAENMGEMFARNRRRRTPEINNAWKLTPAQANEIRSRYAAGGTSYRKLALEYGITPAYVGQVVRRTAMVFP